MVDEPTVAIVRFWLFTALTTGLLRWSLVMQRARDMARHLGPFLAVWHISDPALTDDQVRSLFTDFVEARYERGT